jgi:hypothetical protein
MSKLIRINEKTMVALDKMAEQSGLSRQKILNNALDALFVEMFMKEAKRAYEALQNDPVAWAEEQEELASWDVALSDGLEDE